MKKIKPDQIEAVLQLVYTTNISASQFDGLKQLFSGLEDYTDCSTCADKCDKPKK